MNRRFSIVAPALALFLAAIALPACAATPGTVSGVVRDASGAPQIGALVQLVNSGLTVVSETFTDDQGRYSLTKVLPGVYGVKATASLFLPTLRENLHIAANSRTVVNLTLDTLYQAFRWLPAQSRQVDEPRDDWEWTLRLSANKPLLRMLQDGPLVVVSEGDGQNAALKARVTIRGGQSGFGQGGIHHDFEMERLNDDTRQLILRADLSQSQGTSLNTVVGYEQQLGLGSTLRTVAAFVDRPEIAGGPDLRGVQAMIFRTAESLELTPAIGLEAGGETEIVHMAGTQIANHPFAAVHVRAGDGIVSYRVATAPGVQRADMLDRADTLSPAIAERDGRMVLEHGLHQEVSYAQTSGALRMRVTVFHDRVDNPMVNGGGDISAADWKSGNLLYDSSTNTFEVAGQDYAGAGFVADLRDMMPRNMSLVLSGGMGSALQMNVSSAPVTLQQGLASLRPHQTGMVSAAFAGKLKHAGTEWRASYRWQQPDAVTAVDPFNKNLSDPYLSFLLRQPVHLRCMPNGMEAMVDVRNLLAEGYRPFVSSDGSVLYFAQAPRAIEGGLSFTF
ncbi:MAG: carboxypeptidase-like regulatory domain-containing protein [Acidobacteriaceae bacterium]